MKRDWKSDEFLKMVALGESTTAGGWSTAPERCWVSVLAAVINDFQSTSMAFVYSGIGANVISSRSPCYEHSGKPAADERLDKHVIAHQPDLLIISYGLNDARGGTPLDFFGERLIHLVRSVRERVDPVIVLPGPYYMTDFTVGGVQWSHSDPHYSRNTTRLSPKRRVNRTVCTSTCWRQTEKRTGWCIAMECTRTTSGIGSSPTESSRCWLKTARVWPGRPRKRKNTVQGGGTSRPFGRIMDIDQRTVETGMCYPSALGRFRWFWP